MVNTFIYWLDKYLSMKINHGIKSNFGRTKHEKERDRTSPRNNAVKWSYYTALVAAEYGAFLYSTQREKPV